MEEAQAARFASSASSRWLGVEFFTAGAIIFPSGYLARFDKTEEIPTDGNPAQR